MLEPNKNRANDEKRRRTGLEKKLIVGVSILAVLALVFIILYFTKKSCAVSEEECTEKSCVKAAAELLEYADLKEDPCTDFYRYVCGHYIKDAVKKDSPTPILQIMHEFQNEMKSIVVDPIRKKDSKANIAMKKFYQACMNESKIDDDDDQTFLEDVIKLGGWPLINGSSWIVGDSDWFQWQIRAAKLGLPMTGFFSFRSAESSDNRTLLRVSGAKVTNLDISKSKYESLMADVAKRFEAPDGFGSENIEVYDFMKRLTRLTEYIEEKDDDTEKISKVQDLYDSCPQIPWLQLLNGLSGTTREIKNETEVLYGEIKEYCLGLEKLIKDTPHRVVANFFTWSILQSTFIFLSRPIRHAFAEAMDTSVDRFSICFGLTDKKFQYLKETIYIRRKTKPAVKEKLEELIDIMKEIFEEHIKQSTWMDEETKERGIEKTRLIQKVVGADDVLYDVEKFDRILGVNGLEFASDNMFKILREKLVKENEHLWEMVNGERPENWKIFFERANQVNAFFAHALNIMIIPAPILNSIFFNYKLPTFMNYGSIGRVVGHEIMHGFGEDGRKVILANDQVVDWWTNSTAEAFDKTKQCAIKEYESVPFRYKLNGTLTLEENLADFVGIDIAYEAYQKWVKKHGEEKRLPGISLTPNQIFWIQTGTFLCFKKLDDDATDLTAEDVHGLPGFRVTAGARHSRYFAKDFDCPEGSFMNPKEKCRIL